MNALLKEHMGRVETWTLNRPHVRNALNEELVDALRQAVLDSEVNDTEVVILRGAGRSFCAGADLHLLADFDSSRGQTPRAHLTSIWDLTIAMEHSHVTFVSALHGHAIAGGLELALACDVVVAAHDTLIGDGHAQLSLIAGGGASVRMERAFGRNTSRWLALSGQFLVAQDPAFSSFFRAVVRSEHLEDTLTATVESLMAASSPARAAYKQLLTATHQPLTAIDRDRELDAFDRYWLANDVPQALRRFLNREGKAS